MSHIQDFYNWAYNINTRFNGGEFMRHKYYCLVMATNGNIQVRKNDGGRNSGLIILAEELETMLTEVKDRYLLDNNFLIGKKKVKTVKGVISNL